MFEVYAFLAMFTLQILAMSVLHPAWLTKVVRAKMESYYSDERFAQLYPGIERTGVERFVSRYRMLNAGIAVLGSLLLVWLLRYMQRPDWDDGPVEALVGAYFMLQVLPLGLVAWIGVRSNKKALERSSPEVKRTASLRRRGLFDFVSPVIVFLAVASYFLFAAFVIYIEQDPFPGFAGSVINIGGATLIYALNAFIVYTALYGKKSSPFETRADRTRATGVTAKLGVFSCIVVVAFQSLNFTLVLLNLQRWEPFALSVFLVITALLCSMSFTALPRRREADGLESSPAS
jgi:hypothetical protein